MKENETQRIMEALKLALEAWDSTHARRPDCIPRSHIDNFEGEDK